MRTRNNNLLLRKLNDVGVDAFRWRRSLRCVSNALSRRRPNELPSADKICRAIERVFASRRRAKMDEWIDSSLRRNATLYYRYYRTPP